MKIIRSSDKKSKSQRKEFLYLNQKLNRQKISIPMLIKFFRKQIYEGTMLILMILRRNLRSLIQRLDRSR